MKKLYILCLIILGLNFTIKAQNYFIQGGLSIGGMSFKFDRIIIGPNIFLFQETELTKNFSCLIGLGLNSKGNRSFFDSYNSYYYIVPDRWESTFNYYIEMPLLINFEHSFGTKNIFFSELGPSIGLLFFSHQRYHDSDGYKYNNNQFFGQYSYIYNDRFNLFELSFNFGVGIKLKDLYKIELIYNTGISKAKRNSSERSQIISLSFGYKIKTK